MDSNIYKGSVILVNLAICDNEIYNTNQQCLPQSKEFLDGDIIDILNMSVNQLFETNLVGESVYLGWILIHRKKPKLTHKQQIYIDDCLTEFKKWVGLT
jgi:hypothetical protein